MRLFLCQSLKNTAHLIDNAKRAGEIKTALVTKCPEAAFQGAELALLRYAEKLTVTPGRMEENDVAALRRGLDDGQILEANQIICYFNYVNRSLNGLGVTTGGYRRVTQNNPVFMIAGLPKKQLMLAGSAIYRPRPTTCKT